MTKSYIGLGRHPLSDVRFDAERDLDVSARHAAVVQRGAAFIVQDLGSKNGTFVNGKRVEGELQLKDGDVIGCGAKGPAVEFRILDGNGAPSTVAEQAAARGSEPRAVVPAQAPLRDTARGSTGVRIAVEVAKQTRQLRNTTKVLFVLLIIAAGAFIWLQQKSNQESHEVMLRADSLAAQVHQQLETVQRALRESQTEVTRLSSQLEAARSNGNTGAIGRLRAALDSAEARQRGISGAAAVDYRGISQRNQDAVALVLVEFDNGDRYSGTAFSIDSQGTLV